MAGISPGNLPGGRSARRRRRREIIAAAAALAVVLAVMAGCGGRGSPNTRSPSAPVSTSPAPSPTGTATRPHGITDQELRAWAAALPQGPVPDVPTLAGRPGHYLLVDRGHRVPVPAGVGQLSSGGALPMASSRRCWGITRPALATATITGARISCC